MTHCNVPVISCKGELAGLLSGHSICIRHLLIKEQVNSRPRAHTTQGPTSPQPAGRATMELCAAQSQHAEVDIHTHTLSHTQSKNNAFVELRLHVRPGAFMCRLNRNDDLSCTAVMSWLHHSSAFSTVCGRPSLSFSALKQFSELYDSYPWSSYYLCSGITAFRYAAPTQNPFIK